MDGSGGKRQDKLVRKRLRFVVGGMVEGGDCFERRSALLAARAAAKINAVCSRFCWRVAEAIGSHFDPWHLVMSPVRHQTWPSQLVPGSTKEIGRLATVSRAAHTTDNTALLPGVTCHLVFRDKPSDGALESASQPWDTQMQCALMRKGRGQNRVRPLAGNAASPPAR